MNNIPNELSGKDNTATYDDILNNTEIYEKILTLPDEIAISQYITSLRQVARQYKLTGDFDRLVHPYKEKALKVLKEQNAAKKKKDCYQTERPEWWDGNNVNEDIFCTQYLENHQLYCINNVFFDLNGEYNLSELSKEIYELIKPYVIRNIADRTKRIIEALKYKCYTPPPALNENVIHVRNGMLKIKNGKFRFYADKIFTMNRLDVDYKADAPKSDKWIEFLNQLLSEEDVMTLQEYMGYLLIPSTRAQKMLMIIGNGGEGKSRIGRVLYELMGNNNIVNGSISDLDNGSKARFSRVKLVGKMCMLDDDMDISALEKTDFLKQLISSEILLEIEPKGRPSFFAKLYSRIIAFGNSPLSSLYDRSRGFFRRQIILTAKPVSKNRVNDKYLSEKFISEIEGIFLWCLEGLERLIANDFEFTLSEEAKNNLVLAEREMNNIIPFLESEYNFKFDVSKQIHSREFYWAYTSWCSINGLSALSQKTFTSFLKANASEYGLSYSENCINNEGKRARGFIGAEYTYRPPKIY